MPFWTAQQKPGRHRPSEVDEVAATAPDLVLPLLSRCAATNATAFVTIPENPGVYEGIFSKVTAKHVTFKTDRPIEPPPLLGTICVPNFMVNGEYAGFVAHTIHYEVHDQRGSLLTLNIPDAVSLVEARRTYRVPVDDELPVTVVVRRGEDVVMTGRLVDISRMGLLFTVDDQGPTVERGQLFEVELHWEQGRAVVAAIVARMDDEGCAMGVAEDADLSSRGFLELVSFQERGGLPRRRDDEDSVEGPS